MNGHTKAIPAMFMSPWTCAPREIACHRCRQRKKRCDKKRPTCTECLKAGAECHALKPKKSAASRSPALSYVQRLEEHCATLERQLKRSQPDVADDHLSPLTRRATLERPSSAVAAVTEHEFNTLQADVPNEGRSLIAEPVLDNNDAFVDDGSSGWVPNTANDALQPLDMTMFDSSCAESYSNTFAPVFDGPFSEELIPTSNPGFNLSVTLAEWHVSVSVGERYAQEYFRNAHPMWPFLHMKQWEDCWSFWQRPDRLKSKADWMGYFVDMVLSIGAMLAQNSDSSPVHMETSKSLYERALVKYDSYAIQGKSPLLKAQSALLLTVHAMHLDSVASLFKRAQEAMMQCALAQLHRHRSRALDGNQCEIEDAIRKRTIRTCYIIEILISYSTNHGVSLTDNLFDDDALDADDTSSLSLETSPDSSTGIGEICLEDHVFRLRRIQHQILKVLQKIEYDAQEASHIVPNLWRSGIRHDLSRWITDVVNFSATGQHQDRFMSKLWLLKLANYTIISLFPNPQLAIRSGDARYLVQAASEALITFRRLRVKEHTSCYTWTALLHQFQAGTIMMYSLWATPTHQQQLFYDRRSFCEAAFACYATLVEFARKWTPAVVFQDVFELLIQAIPITEFGDVTQEWTVSPDKASELLQFILALEKLQVKERLILLLREMAGEPRPCYSAPTVDETQWIQYEYVGD